MSTEAVRKFQPNRNWYLRGVDRRGAMAALVETTATAAKLKGVWRDQADFAVLIVLDADDIFGHPRIKYLPNFDLTGIQWTFDLHYSDGLQPIDSPKYGWIDWDKLDVTRDTGQPGSVRLWDYAMLQAGSFTPASGVFDFIASDPQPYDRVTLWLGNIAFDHIAPATLKTWTEYLFFAAGAGTTHSITIDGRTYSYTEVAGDGSADVANHLRNRIQGLEAGYTADPDVEATTGSVAHAVRLDNTADSGSTYTVSATGGTSETLHRYTAVTAARDIRDQINGLNWPTYGPPIALQASLSGAALTVKAARYGTVNTSGTAVTWVSGERFPGIAAGSTIHIAGVAYTVSTLNSPTSITLTASAGTQTGARYLAERGGYDGNMVTVYELHKNNALKCTQASVKLSGGSSDVTWRVSLDFSALSLTSLRQAWLTLAPRLADGAEFADVEWIATLSNFTFSDPNSKLPLKVADPAKSIRIGSKDSRCTYTGSGWLLQDANNLYRGFAKVSKTTNDVVTIRYRCNYTHDLYIGTSLYKDRGIVSVRLDGDTATTLDCFVNAEPPIITRRKVRSAVAAGPHSLEITLTGTKHTSAGAWDIASTDYWFVFDYLEAAVAGDVPDPDVVYNDVSPAIDYDTDHTYKVSPQRLVWALDRLGLRGPMDAYIGVFFWNQRKRHTDAVWNTQTTTFGGTWAAGDEAFITIGSFAMGKTVFPADTVDTIAKHFVYLINQSLVAMWAEYTGTGQLTIHTRTPLFGDSINVTKTSAAGTTSTSGSLAVGTEGTWIIDTAPANPLNYAANAWHADLYAEVAAKSWQCRTALSMELVNPPESAGNVYAARYYDGSPVETDVDFASLKSTHCTFGGKILDLHKASFKQLAALKVTAGLTPWLQFGEFVWWFFSSKVLTVTGVSGTEVTVSAAHGLTSGDTVILAGTLVLDGTRTVTPHVSNPNKFSVSGSPGPGSWSGGGLVRAGTLAYYDAETTAAALLATGSGGLGRALARITCQDQDPATVNGGADAAWLAGRIKAHIDAIRTHVLATYSGAKFELLYPYDVLHPDVYYSQTLPYPQGGRFNHAASTPAAYLTKSGSGLDALKVEALSWGAFYRHGDRAVQSIRRSTTSPWTWPKADTAYLLPIFNGGCPWQREYLAARAAGVPLINMWAYDHVCLMSLELPLPSPVPRSSLNLGG